MILGHIQFEEITNLIGDRVGKVDIVLDILCLDADLQDRGLFRERSDEVNVEIEGPKIFDPHRSYREDGDREGRLYA